ncbi:hypothetical protein ACLBS5_21915, partial [Pseudomonas aeruginosa]
MNDPQGFEAISRREQGLQRRRVAAEGFEEDRLARQV